MSITASEARRRLFPLIRQVNDDAAAVEIVTNEYSAYLVPKAEYDSLMETAFLLRSPANAEHLIESLAAARRGEVFEHALLDIE
jgi:antitoxin YefM